MTSTKAWRWGNAGRAASVAMVLCAGLSSAGCAAPRGGERIVFVPNPGPPVAAAKFTVPYDDRGCPLLPEVDQKNCYPDPTTGAVPRECVRAVRGAKITVDGTPPPGRAPKGALEIHFDPFTGPPAHTGQVQVLTVDANAPYKRYVFFLKMADCPIQDPTVIVER